MAEQGDDTAGVRGTVGSESQRGLVLAAASIVLGAVSFRITPGLVVLPLLGILCGIAALGRLRTAARHHCGSRLATAGMLVSLAGLLVPTVQRGCATADMVYCHTNLGRMAAVGLAAYMADWDDRLPERSIDWWQVTKPYLEDDPRLTVCPADPTPPSYQLEPRLRGPDGAKGFDPHSTVMLFESDDGKSLVWRHEGGAVYAFLDGHTKWLSMSDTLPGYGGR